MSEDEHENARIMSKSKIKIKNETRSTSPPCHPVTLSPPLPVISSPSHPVNRATLGGGLFGPANLPYLEETTTVRVRFNEVDLLRIVWHGHYANFFEEARRAFGRRYGVDYTVFLDHNIAVPVVQLHVDFYSPARVSDLLEVRARLLKSEAAKLSFVYEVRRAGEDRVLAGGSTVQVFTNPEGELLLTWPKFMLERLQAWEPLWKTPVQA
jgi:acyl-CoA thioester hydrolase